jgi:GNAT superfamily N-acetyltransferase
VGVPDRDPAVRNGMRHVLEPPASPADWQAFHDIREAELFVSRGRPAGTYDRNHPDDRDPANLPLLLKHDGRPVGVVRLDDRGDGTAVIRLLAVRSDEQGRGHGRALEALMTAHAAARGFHTLYLNAAPSAVGFYETLGWGRYTWSAAELCGIAAECIQMRKPIEGSTA